ncbi:molecular chaperone GrpE [Angomonas deanei]|uniref:GrpE protein homolog n=1 Tax=Angomonas deanei TaxID=59799 RepID=A0A7G2CHR8_9TRYP|nr:molecular chaperone GrpE [Angomonas deanei]CAD2218233.1 GrpE, putative [Angomonas deanei]|eukprot:EPY38537.1 molecular chaperone GrpE [Angomonas deanei]
MRAFTFRAFAISSQMGITSLRQNKMWCSTETPKAEGDAKKEEETQQEVTPEQLEQLHKELEELKQTKEDISKESNYHTGDKENATRNGKDDLIKARLYGITKFAKDILEVADTLEKGVDAFKTVPEELIKSDKELEAIVTGLKLSIKVLQQNLQKHGVEKMNVKAGVKFDHSIHDALATTPVTPEAAADHVSFVLKDGYKIKERVLRAAQVGVAAE